jgi:hypothetical protein
MFLGVISWRRLASTCWRRQRLRSAMATARLACWLADDVAVELGDDFLGGHGRHGEKPEFNQIWL